MADPNVVNYPPCPDECGDCVNSWKQTSLVTVDPKCDGVKIYKCAQGKHDGELEE